MDKPLAARRLSAGLGRKIALEDIEDVIENNLGTFVTVKTEGLPWLEFTWPFATFALYAGNVVSQGKGTYMKNGRELDADWFDTNELRPLARARSAVGELGQGGKAVGTSSDLELAQRIEHLKKWSSTRR